MRKTRKTRKSRKGGWSWPFSKATEKIVEPTIVELTDEEVAKIVQQIYNNILIRDTIPRGESRRLVAGKNPKKIKLELTKLLERVPLKRRWEFNFVYDEFEKMSGSLTPDKEAAEIIEYEENGVPFAGILYILNRSNDFMKLKKALQKYNPKNYIIYALDDLESKKQDADVKRYGNVEGW